MHNPFLILIRHTMKILFPLILTVILSDTVSEAH